MVVPNETAAHVEDHLIVVTRTMLAVKESSGQMLVWATDLQSGKPLANIELGISEYGRRVGAGRMWATYFKSPPRRSTQRPTP